MYKRSIFTSISKAHPFAKRRVFTTLLVKLEWKALMKDMNKIDLGYYRKNTDITSDLIELVTENE